MSGSKIHKMVENSLLNNELRRLKMIRSIRSQIAKGVVPTPEQRLRTRRSFGILRAERKRLERWIADHESR
jgi:hypothetical protein